MDYHPVSKQSANKVRRNLQRRTNINNNEKNNYGKFLKQVEREQRLNPDEETNVISESEINRLKIEKQELEGKYNELLNTLNSIRREFNEYKEKRSRLEIKIASLEEDKSKLKSKIASLEGIKRELDAITLSLISEKNKLEEENNRLKQESRGEYNRNGVMEKMINNHKERGSVSGVWKGVKELVKMDDALDSKYSIMSKKEIMLDVARILTETKITRSHWFRFEKFFNDKYRIEFYYGVKLAYDIEKKMFNLDNEEIFKKMYKEFIEDKRIKKYKTLNGEIVNKTKKNYTNGRRFEVIPHRRFGEGLYRLGMGARKTKKKVAKSLSNSMKKTKNMFRRMRRKRGEVRENTKNTNNNMTRKSGEEEYTNPYNSNKPTRNPTTGKSLLGQQFYHANGIKYPVLVNHV
jgi:uncharacterized protein YqgV (UPF0045/DUF77 family)